MGVKPVTIVVTRELFEKLERFSREAVKSIGNAFESHRSPSR
jgi:hypothetical protein